MNPIPINADDPPPFVLELIYRLKIKDVMTSNLITAAKTDTLRSVQTKMKDNSITGIPVATGKRLIGMVSMDDIIRALDAGYIEETIEQHMTKNLIVLEDDMPLSFGISYMEKYNFGRFPVLNKTKELVGIITSRDVIVALLIEINKEIEKLEKSAQSNRPPETGGQISRVYRVRRFDFETAGKASAEIKKTAKDRGMAPADARRVAVAAYELEMNQVLHSNGGTITFTISGDRLTIVAADTGPGIENVDAALEEGFSTATDWIRSLGFGAGMGLPNARRVSDEFSVSSSAAGTTVTSIFHFPSPEGTHETE